MTSMLEAFECIESSELPSVLGLANNFETFRELVDQQPAVRALLTHLKKPDNAKIMLKRIDSLVREQDDIRFRNDRDAAVAVYLLTVNQANPSLGKLAASIVLMAPRFWWARKTALAIINGTSVPPEPARATSQVSIVGQWNTAPKRDMREILVLGEPETELVRRNRVLDPSAVVSYSDMSEQTPGSEPKFDSSSESMEPLKKT